MAAYNMGWGMRCDECESQLNDSIQGGVRRYEIEEDAIQAGWKRTNGQWLCPGCAEIAFQKLHTEAVSTDNTRGSQ